MATAFSFSRGGGPIRRLLLFLIGCGVIYLIIVNSLVPVRQFAKYPRDSVNTFVDHKAKSSIDEKHGADADARASANSASTASKLGLDRATKNLLSITTNFSESTLFNETMQSDVLLSGPAGTMESLREEAEQDEAEYLEKMKGKPMCPDIPEIKDMKGRVPQATLLIEDMDEEEVMLNNAFVNPGGRWRPTECISRHKVAIIIPYRDRHSHLTRLLNFLYPILRQQLIDFRFIVTEQYGDDLFNKGRIMNAAFRLAENLNVNCVIFHDVDMFPQDDRNPYGCPTTPRHLGAFVSNLGYQLWYKEIVGGALSITMNDYRTVNGYSNMYWAWGGEDDDMGTRILSRNYTIERPNPDTGRYSMLKHVKRKRTAPKLIYKLLDSASKRWEVDGLNQTGLWKVVRIYERPLYYHLYVDVGVPPKEWRSDS